MNLFFKLIIKWKIIKEFMQIKKNMINQNFMKEEPILNINNYIKYLNQLLKKENLKKIR